MKKLFQFFVGILIMMPTVVFAGQSVNSLAEGTYIGNLSLKFNRVSFIDSIVEQKNIDTGNYIGIEAVKEISPKILLGMEVGYTNIDKSFNSTALLFKAGGTYERGSSNANNELTFIPLELNLKYVIPSTPALSVGVGAGVSYIYVKERSSAEMVFPSGSFSYSTSEKDWLLGGQVFVDANYTIGSFFVGLNGKIQITEDFEDHNYGYSNWRVGAQMGVMF